MGEAQPRPFRVIKKKPHEMHAISRKQVILSFSKNTVSKIGKIVHNEFLCLAV